MNALRVANWERWQSYRSDRGQPPWIKLHRRVLRNRQWVALSDEAKGHLVSIWILAADNEGEIPDDADLIRKLCYLDNTPDIDRFIELRFIEKPKGYDDLASHRRQHDANMTHQKQKQKQKQKQNKEEEVATATARAVLDLFGDTCPMLPRPRILSSARIRAISARRHDTFKTIEDWRRYFDKVAGTPFLAGGNEREWRAGIDWLLKPGNIIKVQENTYGVDEAAKRQRVRARQQERKAESERERRIVTVATREGVWEPGKSIGAIIRELKALGKLPK